MPSEERLYRYILSLNRERIVGETWSTSRAQVLKDVKSNYGPDAKNISVVWLKPDSLAYRLALVQKPNLQRD